MDLYFILAANVQSKCKDIVLITVVPLNVALALVFMLKNKSVQKNFAKKCKNLIKKKQIFCCILDESQRVENPININIK